MNNEISKVSLGFAEFVSHLLHETFDGILDAQNYQINKYADLEDALKLEVQDFRKLYISDSEFEDFQIKTLGFIPKPNLLLNPAHLDIVKEITKEHTIQKMVYKNALTAFSVSVLQEFCLNGLVKLKKSALQTTLNHTEMPKIVVDSGEIKAKLELFCINQSTSDKPKLQSKFKTQNADSIKQTSFDIRKISMPLSKNIEVQEIKDRKTGLKTILVNKDSLQKSTENVSYIPSARIVANPITSSTQTNAYSEITIKFKTI